MSVFYACSGSYEALSSPRWNFQVYRRPVKACLRHMDDSLGHDSKGQSEQSSIDVKKPFKAFSGSQETCSGPQWTSSVQRRPD